jgi:hypothetical protein
MLEKEQPTPLLKALILVWDLRMGKEIVYLLKQENLRLVSIC